MAITETYGRVAALRPADTNEAELYAPASGVEFAGVLRICNQDTVNRTYKVAHTDAAGAAAGEDWEACDTVILAKKTHEMSVAMKNPETIRVQASVADKISFSLSGLTKTTS